VHEPFLGGTPDIGLLVARLYYLGFSYGEAVYAAQPVTSWMTTVVGDPLFRPMLRPAQELHEDLVRRQDPMAAWSHLRVVNLNLAKGFPKYQAVTYLEEIPITKHSAVLSEKLAELYSELGKPSSALRSWQAALDLDPSPQQRIRLQLRLGEKLAEAQRPEEAITVYEQFLGENPNHPQAVAIYRQLIPLAQALGRTNDVAAFQEEITRRTSP
jgi:tetratricopeptide (TPR) repeat protein